MKKVVIVYASTHHGSTKKLVDAISDAIDKSEKLDGATVVETSELIMEEALDYKKIRERASSLWGELVDRDEDNAAVILKKVEMIFGRQIKLSEITEDQVDLFNLVVLEMEDMLKE